MVKTVPQAATKASPTNQKEKQTPNPLLI